jgi:hypothetical protein
MEVTDIFGTDPPNDFHPNGIKQQAGTIELGT